MGFLGPGPLRVHVEHAKQYLAAIPADTSMLADLGSGGGVPGLPVFLALPDARGVLVDSSARRCAFLVWALAELDLADRVSVAEGRAEVLAHDAEVRGRFDVVMARGFGPPASTVECACGFLADGGRIVVSEPPKRRPWPTRSLGRLGLTIDDQHLGVVAFDAASGSDALRRHLPRPIKRQRREPLFEF